MPSIAILFLLAAAALAAPPTLAQDKPPEGGQLLFNNACRTCHTVRQGDNRLGPNLHGIVGRRAGSLPDYGYSGSMKDAGLTWDKPTLDRFIANPDQVVPGHNMKPYGGVASAEDRATIIRYLETAGGS